MDEALVHVCLGRRVTMAEGATMTEAQADRIVEDAGFTLSGFEKVESTED